MSRILRTFSIVAGGMPTAFGDRSASSFALGKKAPTLPNHFARIASRFERPRARIQRRSTHESLD